MAITVTALRRGVAGNTRFTDFTVLFDSSYPTGGEAIAAADWITIGGHGMTAAKCQLFQGEPSTSGHTPILDRTNDKILVFLDTGQVANTTDLSSVTLRCRAWFDNQLG